MRCHNPFAFRPSPVTFWTTAIYAALLIPLVVIHETVPSPPSSPTVYRGLNLTEAWLDLSNLTSHPHPFNSHANDRVRDLLLLRISEILDGNGIPWTTESSGPTASHALSLDLRDVSSAQEPGEDEMFPSSVSPQVVVFNDMLSNVTFSTGKPSYSTPSDGEGAAYFEGTNIMVYVRGTEDEPGEWWKSAQTKSQRVIGKGGVLVNAHYDSVSTGYGATDNGMGVVSALQLVRYFTTQGHQPRKGVVIMFNNAEEDYLYGAYVFGKSPLLPFIHTFLNLEGAGAGGRALLFRTTDQEVTNAYSHTSHPFGTIVASDVFNLGAIRSQTDYSVFTKFFGQRGLDIAFYRPRARYHTDQDDVKHTSRASLWHMLSAAVATTQRLAGDTGNTFIGERPDGARNKVSNGRGHDGVWFDLFGEGFVLFNLRGMFAWSLTILVATPLILMLLFYVIHRAKRDYFFSSKVKVHDNTDEEKISLGGLKGIFRFPLALVVAGALTFGAAFLLKKINPFVILSSEYSVWVMMLSLFYFAFWTIVRGANFARPSALARGYVNMWLFVLGWIVLVAVTVFEDRFRIASGYIFVFWQSALFLSTLITLCEMFPLPKKSKYAASVVGEHETRDHLRAVPNADALIAPSPGELDNDTAPEGEDAEDEDDEGDEGPTETTPLVGGTSRVNTTFATTYRRSVAAFMSPHDDAPQDGDHPFGHEQLWSAKLPTWTWFVQFVLLAPFMIILSSQLGLFLVDAVHQTGPDGSDYLLPYLLVALFSILTLVPMTPFIHRVTHHIPVFLLFVFVGTLIYNLTAFPFSASNRYKAFWQQTIDLDTGSTRVIFGGVEEYIRQIIAELPSAAGKSVACTSRGPRTGLKSCSYDGSDVPPSLAGDLPVGIPPQTSYSDLVSINATRSGPKTGQLVIDAKNTRACVLRFTTPVSKFTVLGGSDWDERFGQYPDTGVSGIKLWRRDRSKPWTVDLEWSSEEASGLEGNCLCEWSDVNEAGTIPAFDEALQYAPTWAAITKAADGLVEGKKGFML